MTRLGTTAIHCALLTAKTLTGYRKKNFFLHCGIRLVIWIILYIIYVHCMLNVVHTKSIRSNNIRRRKKSRKMRKGSE